MAAKIKLQRKGKKKKPIYRVVVQDESFALKGTVIEVLGQYNPLMEPSIFKVDKEKTLDWIKKGAKPTERVRILLGKAGVLPPIDLAALKQKKSKKDIKADDEAAAKAEKEEKSKEKASAESEKEAKPEAAAKEEVKKEEPPKEEVKQEAPNAEVPEAKKEETAA